MNEDEFNLSIRKFLKKVGITSQREIERSIRTALRDGKLNDDSTVKVSVRLSIECEADDIVVEDRIRLQ